MKLVYTDEAIDDLKRLRAFVAAHNPSAVAAMAAELIERIQTLSDFPTIGQTVAMAPVPESVRDMVFGHYIVRYSVHPETIVVLRIWHEREGER